MSPHATPASIVRLDPDEGSAPVRDQPRADRRVEGAPWRDTWLRHEAQGLSAGVWACEVGRWRIAFPAHKQEVFVVQAGWVRLHGPDGQVTDVRSGEAAVIPPGFEGEFEVVEPVRKHFVVQDLGP